MSVIIKMDVPKSCDVCPFMKTNDDLLSSDYRYMYCGFPYMGEFVTDYVATRHPKCPLGEVPTPHGRLIDEQAVRDIIDSGLAAMTKLGVAVDADYLWGAINNALEAAPTIIEAEE